MKRAYRILKMDWSDRDAVRLYKALANRKYRGVSESAPYKRRVNLRSPVKSRCGGEAWRKVVRLFLGDK